MNRAKFLNLFLAVVTALVFVIEVSLSLGLFPTSVLDNKA